MRGVVAARAPAYLAGFVARGIAVSAETPCVEVHACMTPLTMGMICRAFRGAIDGRPPALALLTDPVSMSWLALERDASRSTDAPCPTVFETPYGPARAYSDPLLADDDEPVLAVVDADNPREVYLLTGYVCL